MRIFVPRRVYYEPGVLAYEQGNELISRYRKMNIKTIEIENHNKIPELRDLPDSEFVNMKNYLVLGIRKTLRLTPNNRSADFIVPFTSSGCNAMCLYCYLLCTFFKGSYLRIFVNREEMLEKIRKKATSLKEGAVFELGSNSDMVLENTLTGNLNWAIEQFARIDKATATLATKFSMVEDLTNLDHRGHTKIRMSVNPEYIIRKIEIGTSSLDERINAANHLFRAGYEVGLNIAPIILIDNWRKLYSDMFELLDRKLDYELKKQLFIELIFMTYGYANRQINQEALPGVLEVFDKEMMRPKGRGKYCYRQEIREPAQEYIVDLVRRHFPYAHISYIV